MTSRGFVGAATGLEEGALPGLPDGVVCSWCCFRPGQPASAIATQQHEIMNTDKRVDIYTR